MGTSINSAGPLSAEQVAEFYGTGFLVLETPQILEPELSWCKNVLLKLLETRAGSADGRYFDLAAMDKGDDGLSPQISSPAFYAPELKQLSYRKTGAAVAKQLLGPTASFAGDVVIYKPPLKGGPTAWHQDEALRDPAFDYGEVSIWIALTDCTVGNGPMAYVPKSHLGDVLPHRLSGGEADANMIECYAGFDPASAVVKPIRAGAMIIHHVRTVHGASANLTDSARLAYILTFITPPTARNDHRKFPWLRDFRRSVRATRLRSLRGVGLFREIMLIMRSDRYADRHFISGFLSRRKKQLRDLLLRLRWKN